jgi:hypothetical protein
MKKRLLFISLALVVIMAIFIPINALAADSGRPSTVPVAKNFSVIMTPVNIDDTVLGTAWPNRDTAGTNVWPISDNTDIVGWIIDGRSIRGGLSGDINGGFTFTYGGVLDVLQSGSIQGIVTLKAGGPSSLDVIHMAADGDMQAQVKAYYTFAEIQGWCAAAGIPTNVFFSLIYNAPGLASVPEALLGMAYGASAPLPAPLPPLPPLPLLPKTLTADFSGTVRIDAGTGAYGGSRGTGQFRPNGKQLLTLNVYPNQHVYKIDGQIKMTGTYIKQTPRQIGNIDRDKLKDAIDKFRGNSGNGNSGNK